MHKKEFIFYVFLSYIFEKKFFFRPWDNKDYSGGYATDYSHLRYGFRTRVSLVENQSCILGKIKHIYAP